MATRGSLVGVFVDPQRLGAMYGPGSRSLVIERAEVFDVGLRILPTTSSVSSSLALATTSPVSASITVVASVRPSR